MSAQDLEQRARETPLLERIERMLAGLMREQDKSPSPFKEGQIHALEQIRAIVAALRQHPAYNPRCGSNITQTFVVNGTPDRMTRQQMLRMAGSETSRAIRQRPEPVDLEQFRLPVEAWKSHLDPNDDDESEAYDEADRLLSIIDNANSPAPVVDDAMVERVWELYWRAEKSGDVVVTEKEMHAIASLIARAQGVQS